MNSGSESATLYIGLGCYQPWLNILLEGQEKTWLASTPPQNIDIFHVHGRTLSRFWFQIDQFHEKNRFRNRYISFLQRIVDILFFFPFINWIPTWKRSRQLTLNQEVIEINCPDAYVLLKWKDLGIFDHFIKESADNYLVITTTSSYINLDALAKLIISLPKESVYYGPKPYDGAGFVSGSFRIFSRDIVTMILKKRYKLRIDILEDQAIGSLLLGLGVKPYFIEPMNIDDISLINEISDLDLRNRVHYRLKSGTNNKRNDIQLMHLLHSKITNLRTK